MSSSVYSVMSSSITSDRKNIKTNGSLLHSPTSPPPMLRNDIFQSSTARPIEITNGHIASSSTIDPYQDDAHLYDCPADWAIGTTQQTSDTQLKSNGLTADNPLNVSVYDDSRIYDSPADIFDFAPPVPPHKSEGTKHQPSNSVPNNHDKNAHRSIDSLSSDTTLISSAGSYKTALPELSSTNNEQIKVGKLLYLPALELNVESELAIWMPKFQFSLLQ